MKVLAQIVTKIYAIKLMNLVSKLHLQHALSKMVSAVQQKAAARSLVGFALIFRAIHRTGCDDLSIQIFYLCYSYFERNHEIFIVLSAT